MKSGMTMLWWAVGWILSTATGVAHDFWIEPSSFRPKAGSIVRLRLRVGENLIGDPLPRNNALIDQFVALGPRGPMEIAGRDGGDPAGLLRIDGPGMYLIGYRSRPTFVEVPPEKLETFFNQEGLDRIRTLRKQRGETAKPWRELFSRCAKTLLWTDASTERNYDANLEFRLEIIPEKNPQSLGRVARLPVRILFEGRPLTGVLVTAINADAPAARVSVRTDRQGRATLPLSRRGEWMLKAVHVVPAPAGNEADWESLWASLTFELRGDDAS